MITLGYQTAAFQLPHDSSRIKYMHKSHNLKYSLLYVMQLHPEIKHLVKDTITAVVTVIQT